MIIYEDPDMLVCFKEAGVPVQSASLGVKDMESILLTYLREQADEKNGPGAGTKVPYLGIVHRLDQPVQGLVVFAKTKAAAAALQRQIAERQMEKIYLARVRVQKNSRFSELAAGQELCLTDWLLKRPGTNMSAVVPEGTKGAKKAMLYCRLEKRPESAQETALLRVLLVTGRHHQIRAQLAHAGLPICGDLKYGGAQRDTGGGSTLALCAYELSFLHPRTQERMCFTAPEELVVGIR